MLASYVGIVDRHGLQGLFVERDHVATFLLRRAQRTQSDHPACFWAVVDEQAAGIIVRCLRAGLRREALRLLESASVECGPILPDDRFARRVPFTTA